MGTASRGVLGQSLPESRSCRKSRKMTPAVAGEEAPSKGREQSDQFGHVSVGFACSRLNRPLPTHFVCSPP